MSKQPTTGKPAAKGAPKLVAKTATQAVSPLTAVQAAATAAESANPSRMSQEELIQACATAIKALCAFYGCQLLPVVTVRGSRIVSDVHVVVPSPQTTGAPGM